MVDTIPSGATAQATRRAQLLPDMPLVIWMMLVTIVMGLVGGMEADAFVSTFNIGFGSALGEFALILLPSFILAAALSRSGIASNGAERAATIGAPMAGAGMICPDTAYAALSPAAGRRRLGVAFGAYTGFKLLYPAGPLIVATGLGPAAGDVDAATLALLGIALALPVWAIGVIWARLAVGEVASATVKAGANDLLSGRRLVTTFAPFLLLAVLLGLGGVLGQTNVAILDFLMLPKGALLTAAALSLVQTTRTDRRACFDSGVQRTASLLLVIGAASAFGAVLTSLVPLKDLVPQGNGITALLGLFCLTVAFKLAQGSSMATFAAVAPVAAPIVAASGVSPAAAVFAICLGSFIAILPNDSYYWLVRRDALAHEPRETSVIWVLTGGAVLQGVMGLVLLLLAVWFWS